MTTEQLTQKEKDALELAASLAAQDLRADIKNGHDDEGQYQRTIENLETAVEKMGRQL